MMSKHILIIEDELVTREVLKASIEDNLKKFNITFDLRSEFPHDFDFKKKPGGTDPDLIIIDLSILSNAMAGIRFLERLADSTANAHLLTRIIVFSVHIGVSEYDTKIAPFGIAKNRLISKGSNAEEKLLKIVLDIIKE